MGGFNNNPNVTQFKSALRKLLVKQQVSTSQSAHCQDSDISGAIFQLKWSKRVSPINDNRFEVKSEAASTEAYMFRTLSELSTVQASIIYYISGYVARRLIPELTCGTCLDLLKSDHSPASLSNDVLIEHQYACGTDPAAGLVVTKDRGGLFYPTQALYTMLCTTKKVFREEVLAKRFNSQTTLQRLYVLTLNRCNEIDVIFPRVQHDNALALGEAPHEATLRSKVIRCFLTIRLSYLGKKYTRDVLKRNEASNRSLSSRLTIYHHI